MDKCNVCNKILKKRVFRCQKCNLPFCRGCAVGKICKGCIVINDNFNVAEYFKDKYMECQT